MNTFPLVQKVWNFCRTLRDDGVGYGDYLAKMSYLNKQSVARAGTSSARASREAHS